MKTQTALTNQGDGLELLSLTASFDGNINCQNNIKVFLRDFIFVFLP